MMGNLRSVITKWLIIIVVFMMGSLKYVTTKEAIIIIYV